MPDVMLNKASIPTGLFTGTVLSPVLGAYLEVNHLKQIYRQGWLRRGIAAERCESVAEHSFAVALLSLLIVDAHLPALDRDKIVRMALVHDLGEVYAGDLTPHDGVSVEDKHQREAQSICQISDKLPHGADYVTLWREYEEQVTREARLVRQVDRLEMGLQALVYERQGLADLHEFFDTVDRALSIPELCDIWTEVKHLEKEVE